MRLLVRPIAARDLRDARLWYNEQRPGLGEEFSTAITQVLRKIVERPRLYSLVYRNARRVVVRRFPYLIYYVVNPTSLVVIGCLHSRRDPSLLAGRL